MHRSITIIAALATLAVAACSSSTGGTGGGSSSSSTSTTGTGGMGGSSASGQKLAIGSPCAKDADCGDSSFMCMTDHPGGYCVKMCDIKNADADCPGGAVCQFDGMMGECHKMCAMMSDCRTGYMCAPSSMAADNMASHAFCDAADMPDAGK